ncbi:uncharacterized protein EI90DRAFT_3122206 [Cantharellus anzutake]|uniref:uncharacterized protein n=1 Tax=Cantharellus anzutake TaxID=1750568 RepID=UPI001908A418|nr:uncharacterized protein EI90DRAFT_3122206 [Cantharellus anzutake]KAF8333136.1 hypothetical protein EI90DRAFT_3122206 [Cantharellus anzutake]
MLLSAVFASLFIASGAIAAFLDSRQSGYPACFLPCLNATIIDNFGCKPSDFSCLCKNQNFLDTTAQCLYDKCTNPSDIAQAIATSQAACKAAGVILTSTYTPTQSRSQTGSGATSSTTFVPTTGSVTSTSNSAPSSTKKGAAVALKVNSRPAAGVLGAALLAVLAL